MGKLTTYLEENSGRSHFNYWVFRENILKLVSIKSNPDWESSPHAKSLIYFHIGDVQIPAQTKFSVISLKQILSKIYQEFGVP